MGRPHLRDRSERHEQQHHAAESRRAADRPEKWLNWHAARVLDMIKGSYLFDADAKRIIQDPESLRASSIRQGSTWKEWARAARYGGFPSKLIRSQPGRRGFEPRGLVGTGDAPVDALLHQGWSAQPRPAWMWTYSMIKPETMKNKSTPASPTVS